MKLGDTREAYEVLSGKASDIARQLCLAAAALIWLFKSGSATAPVIQQTLLRGALFVFVALFFDLLQYLVGTVIWYVYFRQKEKGGVGPQEEFLAPEWLNWPAWILFFLKTGCTVAAYVCFLIPFLAKRFIG